MYKAQETQLETDAAMERNSGAEIRQISVI